MGQRGLEKDVPELHNAARAKYDRQAALVRCRALKIPRLDSISTDFG
jgi:hypothetical protein